jgi:hypothetical protein
VQNQQLAELDTALQAIVRRAYDLGRSEALKRVVDVLQEERPSDQLALMAPHETTSEPEQTTDAQEQNHVAKAPWWAWRVK